MSLFAVIAVKDEERYLPGFFNHLRDYVDGFVVLDDGSIDETPNIIKKESKVISVMTNPPHGPEVHITHHSLQATGMHKSSHTQPYPEQATEDSIPSEYHER